MLDVDLVCVASLVGQRLCAPGFHYWRIFFTPEGGNRGKMFADSGLRSVKSFQRLFTPGSWGVWRGCRTPNVARLWPFRSRTLDLGLWTLDYPLAPFLP
jgi:hypothetical protein